MAKAKRAGAGGLLAGAGLPIVLLLALAATNPDEDQFRAVMRAQDKITLDLASLLPIERTNYLVASKFQVKYLVGETTCWGAAAYVFYCPPPPGKARE